MHTEFYIGQSLCVSPSSKPGCGGHKGKLYTVIFYEIFACFCSNQDPNSSFFCVAEIHWIKMVITWHEREHEEEDMIALHDPG